MANNREISQFAGLVTVADSTNNVSLGNTFFLTGNARLGVGTDNPSRIIDVRASSSQNAAYILKNTGSTATGANSALSLSAQTSSAISAGYGPALAFEHGGAGVAYAGALISSLANSDPNGADLVLSSRYYGYVEGLRIGSNGNVGIGTITPSEKTHISGTGDIKLRVGTTSSGVNANSALNLTTASEGNYTIQTGNAVSGGLRFYDTTAGAERMRIGSGGEVLVGTDSTASGGSGGNFAFIVQSFVNEENRPIAAFRRADYISAQFFGSNGGDGNAANCIMRIRGHSSGNRSINAGGSVNASGADYAEYMTKAGEFVIAKGDVCGVTLDGKLTNIFADAISFVVKSTNPSYIGNDIWGIDIENEEEREAERQKVDRIAFAGQVPVNVTGATPGQYIVPIATEDGSIAGIAKDEADLTLAEYMRAVGKVIAIEDDGRARIIVKVA